MMTPQPPRRDPAAGVPGAPRPQPTAGEFVREPDTIDVRTLHAPILRELDEPRDGYEPVPIWLIFCFLGLLMWGGWYLGAYNGGWRADNYNEKSGLGGAPAAPATLLDPLALGKRIFVNCQTCHQANGQGVVGSYPPLAGSEFVLGPPEVLARIVLDGFEGPVTVKGQHFNNRMPPWRAQLSDAQVAAALTYIRQAWGNQAPAVDPRLVAAIRQETAARSRAWTAPELAAVKVSPPAAPVKQTTK